KPSNLALSHAGRTDNASNEETQDRLQGKARGISRPRPESSWAFMDAPARASLPPRQEMALRLDMAERTGGANHDRGRIRWHLRRSITHQHPRHHAGPGQDQ